MKCHYCDHKSDGDATGLCNSCWELKTRISMHLKEAKLIMIDVEEELWEARIKNLEQLIRNIEL